MAEVGGLRKAGRDGLAAKEEVSAPVVAQSLPFERQWTTETRGRVLDDPLDHQFYNVKALGHDKVSMGLGRIFCRNLSRVAQIVDGVGASPPYRPTMRAHLFQND